MIRKKIKHVIVAIPLARQGIQWLRDTWTWLCWRWSRRPYPQDEVLRLHLGCGEIDYPGFVNLDARPHAHVHRVQGLDNLKSFADDSATLIYVSHCLEHFSHRQVLDVLIEWRRVLKPGGVLRVSVPDFDLLLDAYYNSQRDMRSILLALTGGQEYPFNFHYNCFNAAELTRLLVAAGFQAPRHWTHGTETFTSLPDWSGRMATYKAKPYAVSLNMEAQK